MSAKERLDKYLDIELPEQRLLFHVAMLLSASACTVMMLLTLLIRMDIYVPAILLTAVCLTAAAMYAESISDRINLISAVYLFIMYCILLPLMSFYVPYAVYDLPVYFLTGIIYITFLFKKKWALPFVTADSVISLICIYNMIQKVLDPAVSQTISAQYGVMLFFRIIVALFIMGTICGVLTSYRSKILRREIRKSITLEKQAEQLSYAKDMFLVNVSHEIRTPLNAILGVADLLIDQDVDDRVKESAFHMSNSGRALLSITNELMDFSKLEDNDPVFDNKPYYFGDICNELINVISVRCAEYNIALFVDIAPDIPEQLCGDAARVRQVILGLLLESIIKSMKSGEVYLQIRKEDDVEDQIRLFVEVRAEGDFRYTYEEWLQQNDLEKPGENEETLPPPYRFVHLMGGKMHIEEEAGKRRYYFDIRQGYVSGKTLVENQAIEHLSVLLYENTDKQRNAFVKAMRDMGIRFRQAFTDEVFLQECVDSGYTHLMIASERYDSLKEKLEELLSPQSIILIGANVMAYDDVLVKATFARPVSCLNLDALFNGKRSGMIRHIGYKGGFICPDARIMVVDDNIVNLEVAVSILNRYRAKVSVAVSGKECLKMLQTDSVDFILLDYMMPEMDGIDTLKNIRALGEPKLETVPIVALTANAVSGAREMFMEAGFDEYISKPIERDKLERILREYLPQDKVIYTTDNKNRAGQTA